MRNSRGIIHETTVRIPRSIISTLVTSKFKFKPPHHTARAASARKLIGIQTFLHLNSHTLTLRYCNSRGRANEAKKRGVAPQSEKGRTLRRRTLAYTSRLFTAEVARERAPFYNAHALATMNRNTHTHMCAHARANERRAEEVLKAKAGDARMAAAGFCWRKSRVHTGGFGKTFAQRYSLRMIERKYWFVRGKKMRLVWAYSRV